MTQTTLLCILDGFGIDSNNPGNAITNANTPNIDKIFSTNPYTEISASGEAVGLMEGQMGNSEVGHMNIGAGRIVMQLLPKIEKAVKEDTIKENKDLKELIEKTKASNGQAHLIGLLSDGGVHSHINHIISLCKTLNTAGIYVNLHIISDGRDVPPSSVKKYISDLKEAISSMDKIKIATISGRYFAMDRNENWDRTEKFYNAVVSADSEFKLKSIEDIINHYYEAGITDEFIPPTALSQYEGMKGGDSIIIANFRADRVRQCALSFGDDKFDKFNRKKIVKLSYKLGLAEYSEYLNTLYSVMFKNDKIENSLGEFVANKGMKQLRIAETEKYAHVTFFFNGGEEKQFTNEDRILINSPDVATYDMKPEMSAEEITDKLTEEIKANKYDLIVLNFANPDMVGHTGKIPETIKAIECLDTMIGRLYNEIIKVNGNMIITADHGNSEKMLDADGKTAFTAHTTNKVPFVLISNNPDFKDKTLSENGVLADIAPTILKVMGLEQPKEMTGKSLI